MQDFGDIAGASEARLLAAFDRAAADVGAEDNILLREETGVNLRFVFRDIHTGSTEVPGG